MEAVNPAGPRPAGRLRLTPFDRLVWLVLASLWLATGLLIVRGDQVGVQVKAVSPAEGATNVSSLAPIRATFDQPIELSGVLRSLIVEPPASGTAQWEGETLVFYPSEPLLPDTLYTVTIPAGLRSQGGQTVQRPVVWQFRTGHPRVLYLAEDDQRTYQIVLVDPLDSAAGLVQLTREPLGLWDYAPAPDGSTIAYAAIRADGGSDLWAIDPDGGQRRQLLACPEAACSGPAWHPDGQRLVYERRAAGELAVGQGLPRLWWLDLASGEDTLGDSAPAWSPDGREIVLSRRTPGSPVAGQAWVLPASGGDGRPLDGGEDQHQSALSWSPDGRFILSQRIPLGGMGLPEIWLHDLTTGEERLLGTGGAWPRWLP